MKKAGDGVAFLAKGEKPLASFLEPGRYQWEITEEGRYTAFAVGAGGGSSVDEPGKGGTCATIVFDLAPGDVVHFRVGKAGVAGFGPIRGQKGEDTLVWIERPGHGEVTSDVIYSIREYAHEGDI